VWINLLDCATACDARELCDCVHVQLESSPAYTQTHSPRLGKPERVQRQKCYSMLSPACLCICMYHGVCLCVRACAYVCMYIRMLMHKSSKSVRVFAFTIPSESVTTMPLIAPRFLPLSVM
jgi:hypothetical protein